MARPRFAPGSIASFQVKNRSGKKPLDAYLGSRLGVVDAWAADLIASGHVRLDNVVAQPGQLINLSAGPHRIDVHFPEAWPRHMAATAMPLDIIHEDHGLVVLAKPPGIVVHPARGHLDNQTLQNGVRHRYRHLLANADTCIGPPHRLDKDTSGVIVFALRRDVYTDLVAQFSAGRPHKEYVAIMDGNPPFSSLVCDAPLGPDPIHKGRTAVTPLADGGKTARTDFSILTRGDGWALALAIPHTGRPHQIRAHAASLGLPLAGDGEYNPRPDRLGLPRQALHAARLGFRHPLDGRRMLCEAPLPGDLREALTRLSGADGITDAAARACAIPAGPQGMEDGETGQ